MYEMTTDDRAVPCMQVEKATACGWRPPPILASHFVGDRPQKRPSRERKHLPRRPPTTPDAPEDRGTAFAIVEAIRRCIHTSVLGVTAQTNTGEGGGDGLDRLPLLLHNLEAAPTCRCGPPKRLASSTGHPDGATWLFDVDNLFYVLVLDGWSGETTRNAEARSAWPGGAVVYECVLPGWGVQNHGVPIAILSQPFARAAANYHLRFALGSGHRK